MSHHLELATRSPKQPATQLKVHLLAVQWRRTKRWNERISDERRDGEAARPHELDLPEWAKLELALDKIERRKPLQRIAL
jgi:hypothetical protein